MFSFFDRLCWVPSKSDGGDERSWQAWAALNGETPKLPGSVRWFDPKTKKLRVFVTADLALTPDRLQASDLSDAPVRAGGRGDCVLRLKATRDRWARRLPSAPKGTHGAKASAHIKALVTARARTTGSASPSCG